MSRLTIQSQLIITTILSLSALAALMLLSLWNMNRMVDNTRTIYEDRVVPLQQLKTIADGYAVDIIDAVNKADHGLFTAATALERVQTVQRAVDTTWQRYITTELTPAEKQLVKQAQQLFTDAEPLLNQLEQTLQRFPTVATRQLDQFNGPLYGVIDPISAVITKLVDLQLTVAAENYQQSLAVYHNSFNGFLMITAVIIVVVSLVSWRTYQTVMQPIHALHRALEHITTHNDLTHRVAVTSGGEIGIVERDLNNMLDCFARTIEQIALLIQSVAAAAVQLAGITEQNDHSLNHQRQQTEQVVAAMTQMTGNFQEIARHASVAAQTSQAADKEATAGGQVVQSAVTAIRTLSNEVAQTAQGITTLDQQSQQIGSVLAVIKGIAEQTNLLALNAAIEAARAGEQGRGFAVVADEVRTLASQTSVSTADIRGMIETLQRGTQTAVNAMTSERELAMTTAANAEQAGEVLNAITAALQHIRTMTVEIARVTEEQHAVAADINTNMNRIHAATKDMVTQSQGTAGAGQQLLQVVQQLNEKIKQFRVRAV